MADNVTLNPGVGGAVAATDDVGGVHYQRIKLDLGADGVSSPVSGTLPISGDVAPTGAPAPYWPSYGAPTSSGAQGQIIDTGGALVTRGAILTDEGTFRANFANTSLAVSIGTVTVSGVTVTGTGFSALDVHLKDYFKIDADAETAWKQIDSIDSDTQLTLTSAYVGSASGAASRALMQPMTGAGGSITVASGQCVMTSGITSGARTIISRNVDYGPLVFRERLSVSQRVANQNIRIGLAEASSTPRWFARFRLTGTDAATIVTCESGRNPTTTPSASETETTQVTIPGGLTTASLLEYRIEQLTEVVRFYINGVMVAENSKALPSAFDFMNAGTLIENTAVPASSTTVTVDYVTVKNHNKLEIGVMSDAEKIVSSAAPLVLYPYSVAGVIAINTDLMVLDCLQLRSLFIQCTSMGTTGVVTVQWANDTAFTAPITATLLSESGATSTTFNAAVLRVTNVMARYCRLRLTTATTAGTTTLNVWGSQDPYIPIIATQPVSGTVTATVTGYPTAAASADALANPTVTKVDSTGLVFNGTSWDRVRGMSTALTTGDTGAKVATGNGATITNVGNKGVQILVNMGVVSGTTPTAVFKVQGSTDAGTTWYDVPGATTASIVATGQYGITVYPGIAVTAGVATTGTTATANMVIPRTWRIVWTIGGTTPSFTITAIQYIYLPN